MKSTRTYLAVFFFLTTIGAMLLAYHQYKSYYDLQAQLNDPKNGLDKQLADAQKLIKELRNRIAALEKTGSNTDDMAADDQAGGDQGGGGNSSRRQAFRNAMRAVFNSPQFQALRTVQDKAQLDQRYASLFKNLSTMGLTPQQIDQFKNLLVQRQQASDDARQAAMQNGLNPRTDQAAFNQAVSDATSDVDSQIKAALGDSAYTAYQQYNSSTPQRNAVTALEQSLSYSSAPLTDDQANQLVTLLQQNTASSTNGGGGYRGGGGPGGFGGGNGPTAQITNQEIQAASSILNSSQIAALQQLQQTQQAQQQMNQLMRSAIGQSRSKRGGG